MHLLELGWNLPRHGDTTAYALMDAQIPGSSDPRQEHNRGRLVG
jgi:alkanesulfonate monooxygenase